MSEAPKKMTLGEMLRAGERPFVDRERFQENLLAISEHSERVLKALPLPSTPGRPRRDQEVNETEAITSRVPSGNLRLAEIQAGQMGISRNRWINIAISRQLQDPITEKDLKPAIASNLIVKNSQTIPFEPIHVPKGNTYKFNGQGASVPSLATAAAAYIGFVLAGGIN